MGIIGTAITKVVKAFDVDRQIGEADQESVPSTPRFQRALVLLSQVPGLRIEGKGIHIEGPTDTPSFIITFDQIRAIRQLLEGINGDKDKTQHVMNILDGVMERGM